MISCNVTARPVATAALSTAVSAARPDAAQNTNEPQEADEPEWLTCKAQPTFRRYTQEMNEHPAHKPRDMYRTRFSTAAANRLAVASRFAAARRLALAKRVALARSRAVAKRVASASWSAVSDRLSPARWLPARRDRSHLLLYGVWYIELCAAAAAVGSLLTHRSPRQALAVFIYLAACGAALTMPGHLARAATTVWHLSPTATSRVLRGYLVIAAGLVVAFLSTARGWWALIDLLLVGNALWALSVSEREAQTVTRPPTE